MRHARLTSPLPLGLLALAVILLACRRGLVSAARCPHLPLSHSLPAIIAAITLAAITARTDMLFFMSSRLQRGFNAGQQAVYRKRLGEVAICAGVQSDFIRV
jgi:hypothetical protein